MAARSELKTTQSGCPTQAHVGTSALARPAVVKATAICRDHPSGPGGPAHVTLARDTRRSVLDTRCALASLGTRYSPLGTRTLDIQPGQPLPSLTLADRPVGLNPQGPFLPCFSKEVF